jgi:serine protease AprX
LPNIPDLTGHAQQTAIESAIKSRLIDVYADGLFRPDQTVSREDLARSMALNASLRQTLGASEKFSDAASFRAIAEAVTANGSTLRDFNFVPKGLINTTGNIFNPAGNTNRLDMAVAFVRALGHDEAARARANQTVMFNGAALSDNAQIPGELRGYVQLAIDKGLFEAFPAEVRNLGNGQFQVLPGPRFEPASTINRATLAVKLNRFNQLFTTGG